MRVLRVYHAGRDAAHRQRELALHHAGVDVTLVVPFCWDEGGAQRDLPETPYPIVELPVRRSGDVNRHRYADDGQVCALVNSFKPDVLDLHEEPFSAVTRQWLRAVSSTTPVVAYSAQNIDKRFPPPFAQWERAAFRRLAGLYPCSRQAASVLRGKGFAGRLDVLPLGIDPTSLSAGTQRHDDPVWTLLLVGRLVPEKGVLDSVRLLAELANRVPARLVMVGRGPEAAPAERLAQELGVADRLELVPWVDAEAMAGHYRGAHITLVPSSATRTWVEQFGRVITEAQAAGSVVVGYASGAIPEVGGSVTPLVAEGDVAGLAGLVSALQADEPRWERLRAGGLQATATRTWQVVAHRQRELYEAVLAAPRQAATIGRLAARAEFGPPAEVAGGGRPFALPLLREDTAATRALARVVDLIALSGTALAGRR